MVSLLLIGDLSDEVPSSVLQFEDPVEVTRAGDLDAATRLLAGSACPPPEVVVLAESRGGQFSHAALDGLRKLAPLARVWRLLGSWCEGEARSGHPPAGVLSTNWHHWQARFAHEVETAHRGGRPNWALPLTASADERILADTGAMNGQTRCGTIAICASSAPAADALADLCRAAGYDALVVADDGRFRIRGASAVLWDATIRQIVDAHRVAEMQGRSGGAPLLAIVGFPRADDVELARRAGIAAVISKPFLAGDLLWHLERVVAKTG